MSRFGVLFRSGHLSGLDEAGGAAFAALGIRRVIDLRDDDEVAGAPSRIDGREIEVRRVPLFLGSAESFFVEDVRLPELYRRLLWDDPGTHRHGRARPRR